MREMSMRLVLAYLTKHPRSTIHEIADGIWYTRQHTHKVCTDLLRKGVLRSGQRIINGTLTATYSVRDVADTTALRESILQHIRDNPGATAAQIKLAVDRCSIYVMLGRLSDTGHLRREKDFFNERTGRPCYRYWRTTCN